MPTTNKRFVLTAHAHTRAAQRFAHAPVTNLSIRPPKLPEGVRYPLQPVRGSLRMTASAFFVADRTVVLTLVPVPVEVLAAVLVRILLHRWVIDEDDGFRRADPEQAHNAREKTKRLRQKKFKKNRRYT